MATTITLKRGTAAQVAAITPAEAEPVWKTDDKVLVVGDGSTAGGIPIAMAGSYVAKALYDANTILKADVDDIPLALTVGAQTLVGRKTGGNIAALSGADALLAMGISATVAQINYLNGVTSDIQAQIDLKAPLASPTFTGVLTAPTILVSGLTASEILGTDASKNLVSLAVATYPSLTELAYVKGVTSAIQTQLGLKAPLASPTFTGTVTLPTPFTIGAVSMTATGTELNYVVGVTSAIQTQLGLKAPLASPTFTGTVTLPTGTTLVAPLKFVSGVVLTSPVAGTMEFVTDTLSFTITTGAARKTVAFLESPSFTTPTLGAAVGTSLQLSGLTASEILGTDGSKNLVSLAVATYPSLTELSYVKGVSSAIQTQMNLKAPLASPTFTGTVVLPTPFTIGAVSMTATGTELNYVVGVTSAIQTQMNLKAPLASPTFTGTVTLSTATAGGSISFAATYGIISAVNTAYITVKGGTVDAGSSAFLAVCGKNYGYPGTFVFYTPNAAGDTDVARLTITGLLTTATATWSAITHTGIVLTASEKIYPVSGVAGFSVVSTALTLGSLGSVIIPQSAANVTDALAGNIAGAIALDLTSTTERLYFRGTSWFYISKSGGLSMTKEERIDPLGHKFEVGDMVKLVVDKVNPDGSFHALPTHQIKEDNMAKQLQRIELNIVGTPNPDGTWEVKASADLTVGIEEYPDFEPRRKGIPITMTSTQETTIKNFVKNVVLPQAEASK